MKSLHGDIATQVLVPSSVDGGSPPAADERRDQVPIIEKLTNECVLGGNRTKARTAVRTERSRSLDHRSAR